MTGARNHESVTREGRRDPPPSQRDGGGGPRAARWRGHPCNSVDACPLHHASHGPPRPLRGGGLSHAFLKASTSVAGGGAKMNLRRRRFLHLAVGALAAPGVARFARAQSYPARPVRLLVGFPAGNAPDIMARLLGQFLSDRLGQQFIIDNRPGAASNIALEAAANAPADGYTLLMVVLTNVFNATLYPNLKFNFVRDIAPVAGIADAPYLMMINPSVPAKTVPE